MKLKEIYDKRGEHKAKMSRIDFIRFRMITKEIKSNSSVLDIGGRNGELKEFLPDGCKYVICDISQPQVERAKKNGLEAYCFDVCLGLPKELENKFDYVIIGEVIEHFPNPFNALVNIRKALKKDGILLGTTPNLFSLTRILYRLTNMGAEKYNDEHIIAFDVYELRNMLSISGFKPIKIKRTTFMYIFDSFFGWYIFFKAKRG